MRPFLDSLKEQLRGLNRICALGSVNPLKQFEVIVFAAERSLVLALNATSIGQTSTQALSTIRSCSLIPTMDMKQEFNEVQNG